MKLFKIEVHNNLDGKDRRPYCMYYTQATAAIVYAENEEQARKLFAKEAENGENDNIYLNSEYSDCEEIILADKEMILLQQCGTG